MNIVEQREHQVRLAAFEWLAEQVDIHGDVLPRTLLLHGFEHRGERISLISQQGIFKPKVFRAVPISITTTIAGPYDDSFDGEGLLRYRYRGTDPAHHESNRKSKPQKKEGATKKDDRNDFNAQWMTPLLLRDRR